MIGEKIMRKNVKYRVTCFLMSFFIITSILIGSSVSAITEDSNNISMFTQEEIDYISSNPKFVIGAYLNMEPMSYMNDDDEYKGVYIDIIKRIKEISGLDIELYPISDNSNWVDLIRENKIDCYIGSADVIVSNISDFISTDPFMNYDAVLITKNDYDLSNYPHITIAMTRMRTYWRDNMPGQLAEAKVEYYDTAKDCLIAVQKGKVDAAFISTNAFNYQSKNTRFADLMQWETWRYRYGTCITFKNDVNPLAYSVLNKSLGALSDEEIDNITYSNMNIQYSTNDIIDYFYAARYVLVIVFAVLIIFVICIVFVYMIKKRQKAILDKAQEEQKKSLNILSALSFSYESVYAVNLDEDSYKIYKITNHMKSPLSDLLTDRSFSKTMLDYINTVVQPQYRKSIENSINVNVIIEKLSNVPYFTIKYKILPNENNQEYFEMHFVRVGDDPKVHTMVLGFRCIDEMEREEDARRRALSDAYEAANRANHAKSDFLSRMSHDIRTPMNAIIGLTAIAATHAEDPQKVRESLKKISASSSHLLGLINEVLDMSKIESGTFNLVEEDVNLPELINDMITMMQPKIAEHEHELHVHILDMEHEDVIGDSLRIQRVFINILSNAVNYTPDHGVINVTVREKSIDKDMYGCYEFVFEDNGIGMTPDFVEHIFEPFSRAEDLRISKTKGTGLGMAIAQNIVHMMNGNIRVESSLGKGSRFTVTVFLRLQNVVKNESEIFAGLDVLVVDDDDISCDLTCNILSEIGMNSEYVMSGREAMKRVADRHERLNDYSAVIVDWKMPDMDGVETARKIRQLVGAEVPVIILSAYDWSEIENEAREAGVDAFLSKPIFRSGIVRLFKDLYNGGNTQKQEHNPLDSLKNNDLSDKRILLVEDNDLNREIAIEILSLSGIKTEEAENGKEAVEKFMSSPEGYYDLILMDIQMPIMNGYKATSTIRALKRSDAATVPIVAMTANAFAEDVEDAKASGMNEHLSKPIDFDKLSDVLHRYIG